MTTETREVLFCNQPTGTFKEIKEFHPLKNLAPNTEIVGKHLARKESKTKEGYFYHLFENEQGEVHAYGTCKVLDERVKEFEEQLTERGLSKDNVMMGTTFLGRLKNKNNANTSYKFTKVVAYPAKQSAAETVATIRNTPNEIDTSSIPF